MSAAYTWGSFSIQNSVLNVLQLKQLMIEVCCNINELCCKSFHIINKTVFYLVMLVSFAIISDSIAALHPIYDNPLTYQCDAFSVIFTSESQFN